jgi:hypothetical protein
VPRGQGPLGVLAAMICLVWPLSVDHTTVTVLAWA